MFKKTLAVLFSLMFALSVCVCAVAAADVPAAPTGLTIKAGQTLADAKLENTCFSWEDDASIKRYKLGDQTFYLNYDENNDGEFEATHIAVIVTIECDHDWDAYKSNGDATFLKDGTKTRVCKICGAKDEAVVDQGSSKLQTYLNKCADSGNKVSEICGKVLGFVIGLVNKLIGFANSALNK